MSIDTSKTREEPDLQGIGEHRLVAYLEERGYRVERIEEPVTLADLPKPCEGEWGYRDSVCDMLVFCPTEENRPKLSLVDASPDDAYEYIENMARQLITDGKLDDAVKERMEVIS